VRGEAKIGTGDVSTVLAGYIDSMHRLVAYLDRYQPES
jgi:hypothetical protein